MGVVAGIDLAAKPTRCSGFSVIEVKGRKAVLGKAKCLGSDESILWEVRSSSPMVVAIDAPLMRNPRMRGVDRELLKRGIRVFPPNFSWMKQLSLRGWRIANSIAKLGIEVIETHPRSALLSAGASNVFELLQRLGVDIKVDTLRSKDIIDSAVSAAVAYCHLKGCSEIVSDGEYRIYLIKKLSA